MANKIQKLILGLLCLLFYLGPSSSQSQPDTLVQGQKLKYLAELYSVGGRFRIGFIGFVTTTYVGIWYNSNADRLSNIVWIANRDSPILNTYNPATRSLTIDDNGDLKITYKYNGDLNSIVLYSGHETSNVSDVLLDSGNFVLSEISPSGRKLWKSFDYPSHVLLPGMKLGVNRKTGQTWFLTSWTPEVLDSGNFTFGLHPNRTDQLVILLHGDIYWTSGYVNVNSSSISLTNSHYSFDYTSNENETYFCYSAVDLYPMILINYLGVLSDDKGVIVNCTSDSSYLNEGCAAKVNIQCRSLNETFSLVFGSWHDDGFKFNEGDNLTLMDCKAKCLNNCSCVAYASTNEENQTGCEIWSTGPGMGAAHLPFLFLQFPPF